jgi:hypothetical protein
VLDGCGLVLSAGGCGAFSPTPGRGPRLGGATAGGLGLDQEFLESVLVPQVMLYGFLGAEPRPGGLRINPRMPADWPSLTVTRIQAQGHVLDVTATPDEVRLTARVADDREFLLWPPDGRWRVDGARADSDATAPFSLRFTQGRTITCRRVKD